MPRTSRIVIADYPHHIIQRGHNKQTVFATDQDYQYYFENVIKNKSVPFFCHFELTVREMGLSGEWVLSEQNIEKPDELTEYIVTWQQEEISQSFKNNISSTAHKE